MNSDLREFIESLRSKKVDFLIVGGHAVAFHGYPRYTGDVDVLIRPSVENAERLLEVLDGFGFGQLGLTTADFSSPGRVLQLGRPPNRIDVLTSISGLDFEQAWQGRVEGELGGLPVTFLSRDSLLANKRASGRPQDLADIAALKDS